MERLVFGHLALAGERRAAELAEIDVEQDVASNMKRSGDAASGLDFVFVALTIAERDGVGFEAFVPGDGKGRGRVESAAEQNDGVGLVGHFSSPQWSDEDGFVY